RVSTLWSSVMPLRPALRAFWEIPLDAASVLKADSQESKLPVPQGAAASADVAGSISAPAMASASHSRRKVLRITRKNPIREFSSCSAKCFRQPGPKHGCCMNGEPPAFAGGPVGSDHAALFPGEQVGRKVRGRLALVRRPWRDRPRIGIDRD